MDKSYYTMNENSIIIAPHEDDVWVGRLKYAHQFYYWVSWNGNEFGTKLFIGDIEFICKNKKWTVVTTEKDLLAELLKFK